MTNNRTASFTTSMTAQSSDVDATSWNTGFCDCFNFDEDKDDDDDNEYNINDNNHSNPLIPHSGSYLHWWW